MPIDHVESARLAILVAGACLFSTEPLSAADLSLLPQPATVEAASGSFALSGETRVEADKPFAQEAELLKKQLVLATGFGLTSGSPVKTQAGAIRLIEETATNGQGQCIVWRKSLMGRG